MKKRALLTSLAAMAALACLTLPSHADALSDGIARAKENLAK